MKSTDFGDPVTFHLMPPAGQRSQLYSDKFQHPLDGLNYNNFCDPIFFLSRTIIRSICPI